MHLPNVSFLFVRIGYNLVMNPLILFAAEIQPRESLLVWYLTACGPFFGLLFVFVSIVFVTLTIMNWLAISRNAIVPPEMIEQFQEKLEAKEYQEAYEIAKNSDTVLGRILAAGLVKMSDNVAAAEQTMNDTAEEEIMTLEHRLGYLGTVASVSPMIGLLGTVWGMTDAFSVIAQSGVPQASEIARGIARALVTTQIGLLIAIPALVLFEVFKSWLARLVLELSIQTDNVLNRFKQN
jgi:biopolymer transport protein ExbB